MAPPAPSVARSSKSRASRGRSSHHSDHEEETISIHEKITEEVREGSVSSSSFSDSMEKVKKRRRAKRPDKAFVLEREESRSVRGPLNLLSAPSRSRSRARSRRDLEEEVRILERERDSKSSTRAKSRSKSRRRKSTSLKIRPEIDLNIVKNRKGEIELVRN